MNATKLSGFALAIVFGAFLFIYGEYDDSPGGQLLGLLAVVVGIVGVVKTLKKTSKPTI